MFSKLLLPKVIIVLIAVYFIYTSVDHSGRNYILNGYTDKMSGFPGDTIKMFIQPNKEYKKAYFPLYDILDNKKDVIVSSAYLQTPNTEFPWSQGFNYKPTLSYIIPEYLKSGIYILEKKIPFIVKNPAPAEIVIVYPFNSINLNSDVGGKSFYFFNSSDNIPSDTLSFERPYTIGIDSYIKAFFLWINKYEYPINYIADTDLDESSTFDYAKIVIIPGESCSWTRKARENFDNYISNGGNAIILSANSMFWSSRYNEKKDKLIVYKNSIEDPYKKDPTGPWEEKNFSAQKSIITAYEHGGYPSHSDKNFGGFKIIKSSSPLLAGTNIKKEDTLKISNRFVDGLLLKIKRHSSGAEITVKDPYFLNCYKKELIGIEIAFQNGNPKNGAFIVAQKTKESGVIINTSSSDWCSANGIGGKDSLKIQKITLNMISLLLNGHDVFSSE